ncbi:hypothetical protein HPB49_000750 [Dermacentor silvarum]|uniref:Uncharacterized protein n=1 Tax=Dermacentor silvarum TaxID=543639 RepID=A0ACB8CIY2_DERSI|nr:hypothetical protein HPB49_000750 [Dermacentor silvarum]
MSLSGRLALVTGGASGIGEAVCQVLAEDGAVVVVADKQLEAARKVAGSLPALILQGTFLVTREASRYMLRSGQPMPEGGASIVNVASIFGKTGQESCGAYAASKGGVVALTKSAAQELAAHGIRCNAVLPGWIETPMSAGAPEGWKDAAITLTPLGRTAQPREVAETIKFLCSPTSSSFVTGAAVEVSGGWRM